MRESNNRDAKKNNIVSIRMDMSGEKISSLLQGSFAKETYSFIDPTHCI